jgi:Putative beta-barrel porin-2, OmpL-like. bbp2
MVVCYALEARSKSGSLAVWHRGNGLVRDSHAAMVENASPEGTCRPVMTWFKARRFNFLGKTGMMKLSPCNSGRKWMLCLAVASWGVLAGAGLNAQSLPTPAMSGPLQTAAPHTFDAGPFGKLDVTGQGDLSNGQVFIQKTDGGWQFYLQAGAYNIPALATPYLSTARTLSDFYGPLPVGYLKLAPAKNTSILIGKLPTLMGAEYTFTFENMNIDRGLLWNQENAVNRGIQVNQTVGKFTASMSWNDGYYSNRYSWLSGSLTYANGPHSLAFSAMGNLGATAFRTAATPAQNNGSMYALIYTYTKGNWIVQPYAQFGEVPTNRKVGNVKGASTQGEALLVNYIFKHGLSLAGRGEYISSTGTAAQQAVNLLFGPGSGGWSATLTPTFQKHGFFIRGDLSLVEATHLTAGDGFGPLGMNRTQRRGLAEAGFIF